jgi:hypothetical protein
MVRKEDRLNGHCPGTYHTREDNEEQAVPDTSNTIDVPNNKICPTHRCALISDAFFDMDNQHIVIVLL